MATNPNLSSETDPTSKPTILFIHGSWHTPSHFNLVRDTFHTAGYETSCPRLASADAMPPISIPDDARVIQDELSKLVLEDNRDVVVIGHSYGGILMTEAVTREFSKTARKTQGLRGGVSHLVYMAAFMIPVGKGLAGAFDGRFPPWLLFHDDGTCTPADPASTFYHDIPTSEQERYVQQLVKTTRDTQYDPITHGAYLHYPVTYLYCRDDRALPVEVQQMMVESTEASTGITVKAEYCDASHSPFLSMPGRVLEVVEGLSG